MAENKQPKSKLHKVFTVVGYVAVGLIALILVFVLICNVSGRMPFVFGYTTLWVRTQSMEDVIPASSYILVREADASEVKVGDVIVFYSDDPNIKGSLNTHRVVEIIGDNEEFVTRGDNNSVDDAYTAKSASVVGIYVKNLPFLSLFGRLLSTEVGMVSTIALMFIIILAIYVPDMVRARREDIADRKKAEEAEIEARIRAEVQKLKEADAAKNAAEQEEKEEPDIKEE